MFQWIIITTLFGDVFRLRNTCINQGWDGSCTWAAHAAVNPAHSLLGSMLLSPFQLPLV